MFWVKSEPYHIGVSCSAVACGFSHVVYVYVEHKNPFLLVSSLFLVAYSEGATSMCKS